MSKKDDSQKFFTVQYSENGGGEIKTTKIPAKKGISLKDALDHLFTTHYFFFETCSVFLETSQTPLPIASDCFTYGGCTLLIKRTEEAGVDQRIVSMMNNKDKKIPDKTKRYSSLLLHYSYNGFDEDETDSGKSKKTFDEEFFLETSWKDVVDSHGEMESPERVQQESIWELISTEKTYIADLRIVTEVFKKGLTRFQQKGYLLDVDPFLIFANIDEIYDVNVKFWKLLIAVVENSRKTRQPMKPGNLLNVFCRFESLFQPYITFCNEDAANRKLPNFSESTNEQLKEYLNWCGEHPKCKGLELQGFLIKPLQRVTKYSLLLRAVQDKTFDKSDQEMLDIVRSRVETSVSKINSAVHMRQEREKALSVLERLETYTPVEAVNEEAEKIMNEYSMLDLKDNIAEIGNQQRLIIKEGNMRLVEKQVKKDVHGFLFTDVFVLVRLKKNTDKYKVIRQPFCLKKTVIRALKDPGAFLVIYLNEYNVMSNAFVLQINPNEREEWLSAIEKAKNDYESKIKKFQENKLEYGDLDLFNDNHNISLKRRIQNRFSTPNSATRDIISSRPLSGILPSNPTSPSSPKSEYGVSVNSFDATEFNDAEIHYVKYDFAGDYEIQLSVQKGDLIRVANYDHQKIWCEGQNKNGKIGLLPFASLMPYSSLYKISWYHGRISERRAVCLMNTSINGSFLVRESEEDPGQHALSLRFDGRVHHYRVHFDDNDFAYMTGEVKFKTLEELVAHHTRSSNLVTNLRYPVLKVDNPPVYRFSPSEDEWEIPRMDIWIGQKLGCGQYGEVYRAEYRKYVAVKTLKESHTDVEEFLNQADMMKQIKHENLVKLIGVCRKETPIYIVTEYMPYGNLLEYLQQADKAELPAQTLLYMASQVALGMKYLESRNFIHRNLAARNCFVGENNLIKVADFGLARSVLYDYYNAHSGAKFPIKWTSPEALAYNKFSTKSDVWAFGVLLWEILTYGSSPYPSHDMNQVYGFIEKGYRMKCPDDCPEPAYDLMLHCWEWEPDNRPTFVNICRRLEHMLDIFNEEIKKVRKKNQDNSDEYETFFNTNTPKNEEKEKPGFMSTLSSSMELIDKKQKNVREERKDSGSSVTSETGAHHHPPPPLLSHQPTLISSQSNMSGSKISLTQLQDGLKLLAKPKPQVETLSEPITETCKSSLSKPTRRSFPLPRPVDGTATLPNPKKPLLPPNSPLTKSRPISTQPTAVPSSPTATSQSPVADIPIYVSRQVSSATLPNPKKPLLPHQPTSISSQSNMSGSKISSNQLQDGLKLLAKPKPQIETFSEPITETCKSSLSKPTRRPPPPPTATLPNPKKPLLPPNSPLTKSRPISTQSTTVPSSPTATSQSPVADIPIYVSRQVSLATLPNPKKPLLTHQPTSISSQSNMSGSKISSNQLQDGLKLLAKPKLQVETFNEPITETCKSSLSKPTRRPPPPPTATLPNPKKPLLPPNRLLTTSRPISTQPAAVLSSPTATSQSPVADIPIYVSRQVSSATIPNPKKPLLPHQPTSISSQSNMSGSKISSDQLQDGLKLLAKPKPQVEALSESITEACKSSLSKPTRRSFPLPRPVDGTATLPNRKKPLLPPNSPLTKSRPISTQPTAVPSSPTATSQSPVADIPIYVSRQVSSGITAFPPTSQTLPRPYSLALSKPENEIKKKKPCPVPPRPVQMDKPTLKARLKSQKPEPHHPPQPTIPQGIFISDGIRCISVDKSNIKEQLYPIADTLASLDKSSKNLINLADNRQSENIGEKCNDSVEQCYELVDLISTYRDSIGPVARMKVNKHLMNTENNVNDFSNISKNLPTIPTATDLEKMGKILRGLCTSLDDLAKALPSL